MESEGLGGTGVVRGSGIEGGYTLLRLIPFGFGPLDAGFV